MAQEGEPALQPDEVLRFTLGRGEQAVEIGCRVVAAHGDAVALRAEVVPLRPERLRPGTGVWLVRADGRRLAAALLAVEHGPPPLLRVRLAAPDGSAANRRAFYRAVMHFAPAQAVLLADGRAALCWVRLVDLSGNGARLLCPRPVRVGDTLYLRLPLPDGLLRELPAQAVWCRPTRAGWQAGVRFLDLSDRDRDLIVRAVFQQELRLRRP